MNPFRKLKSIASTPKSLSSQPLSTPRDRASSRSPDQGSDLTVIELFQSQSCSSCPPANNHLLSLIPANSPDILLLTYEVTYWNHLSWIDTFSDLRWDKRQREYVRAMGLRSPFTPQVIIDGGARMLDEGWWNIERLLKQEKLEGRDVVSIKVTGLALGGSRKAVEIVGSGKRVSLVQAVWYEVEPAPVKVLRGENRGVTLDHRNVVRDLEILGQWEGGIMTFELPPERKDLQMAVLVQNVDGGHILGAVRA